MPLRLSRRVLLILLFSCQAVTAQEFQAEQKIKALKKLTSVAIVLRPNARTEVLSFKELGDLIEAGLGQKVPKVKTMSASDTSNWLVLSYITTADGGEASLTLYRHVIITESGETTDAAVWDDSRIILNGVSQATLKEVIVTLLTAFAADYYRANR